MWSELPADCVSVSGPVFMFYHVGVTLVTRPGSRHSRHSGHVSRGKARGAVRHTGGRGGSGGWRDVRTLAAITGST